MDPVPFCRPMPGRIMRHRIIRANGCNSSEQPGEMESHKNDEPVNAEVTTSEENTDHVQYGPLYKAVLENDWEAVDDFISKDPNVLTTKIKVYLEETVIHIIARNLDVPVWLLEKIVSMVPPESLAQLEDEYQSSPMLQAATYGNTKAAKVFVRRNKDLPNITSAKGVLPIHRAAMRGHKDVFQYLLSVTNVPLDDKQGVKMLQNLINSGFYDIALDLLKRYPMLACEKSDRGSILLILANQPQAFESGLQLGFWEHLIYHWIPVQEERIRCQSIDGDVENAVERSKNFKKYTPLGSTNLPQISIAFGSLRQKLYIMLWNALMQLAPRIKCIGDQKLTHRQTLEIVRIMCHQGVDWSHQEARMSLQDPVLTAAKLGIYELVKEIMEAYFFSFTFTDINKNDIFRLAAIHRHDKVLSLVNRKDILLSWDVEMKEVADIKVQKDNILHLVARFVPSKRGLGAARQLQRELQWLKTIESCMHPSRREQRNMYNQTPRDVFTQAHRELVKEGEEWMKGTASKCTVVAALIITVMFAAALTVPGGSDSITGLPAFLHKPSFLVFVISDSVGLFSSAASLLMFLAVLTSRFSVEDFLKSLPNKLFVGLITLFFSMASMMVAFGAIIYIFLSHRRNELLLQPQFLLDTSQ